ncbi:MAG: glycosyltransferase family protein [Candidatus Binatia bacterium]
MSSILYYITGHGFGHAVRSQQVVRALLAIRPELRIHVRTTAPEWIFHDTITPTHYSRRAIDTGIVQSDSLHMELAATLAVCRAIYADPQKLIDQELAFVKANAIDLIVADTPPLAFEIAAQAGVPSVSITNFTWDVIYRAYVEAYPEFAPLIDTMTQCYGKATHALTLPYPCDTAMFPRQQRIPWIARKSELTKTQARQAFALPQTATIVLLSFGGLGLDRLPWKQMARQPEYFFVLTGTGHRRESNLLTLPETQTHYQDLLRAADAIVTKPGYGIVADVLAQHVPILYTDRGDFAEYPQLVAALRNCATAEFIPQQELLRGNLSPYLSRLLAKPPHWPDIELNGAQVATQKILAMLDPG